MEEASPFSAALRGAFGDSVSAAVDGPVVDVPVAQLFETLKKLRDDGAFAMSRLVYVTATDEMPQEPRFRLVYLLHSMRHKTRVRVVTRVPESEEGIAPSVVPLWLGADWMEREVFDMFGVRFANHPDLRRILMPEDYGHHPLRKDFPIEGIEPDRLYREWEKSSHAF